MRGIKEDIKMIKFYDIFKVENPAKTRVKFNMNPADPSLPAWDFLRDDDTRWVEMNAHRYTKNPSNNLDNANFLLAFAQYYPYGPQYYIFGGMYKVEKILPEIESGTGYKLTLLDEFKEYRKRLIIKLAEPIGRNIYTRLYEKLQDSSLNPEIYEIAPTIKLENFPGYSNVLLSHNDLQTIIRNEAPQWKNALSSVKGVYCITDKSTGQLYIGSASGEENGIWQRWSAYANVNNLTGGNKTFEDLKKSGAEHIIDNFSYSILEIFDMRTNKEYIIQREEHWKRVFQTVKFGMNNVRKK